MKTVSQHLRIDYLGGSMRTRSKAFAGELRRRGHVVTFRQSLADLPMNPAPDVVIHEPLEKTLTELSSTCALAHRVPASTLLVPVFCDVGPSRAMFTLHARRRNCHPRILLHWRENDAFNDGEIIDHIEVAVANGDGIAATYELPAALDFQARVDLGEIMSNPKFTDFLYTAAKDPSWGSWAELSQLLNVANGAGKNTNTLLGRELGRHGLIDPAEKWTVQRFVRFVTEFHSFILAFGQHHLNLPAPTTQFWMPLNGATR